MNQREWFHRLDEHPTCGTTVKTIKKQKTMNNQYVAYLRVSTQKQEYSGLGLEVQRGIIQKYLCDRMPIAEYIEIESGRKKRDPN